MHKYYTTSKDCSISVCGNEYLCMHSKRALVFKLNETAMYILSSLQDGAKSLGEIKNDIAERYGLNDNEAEKVSLDVENIVDEFMRYGLVTVTELG